MFLTDDAAQSIPYRGGYRFLTVRIKTLLIFLATLVVLLVILYIPLRAIMLDSLIELEQQTTRRMSSAR